MILCVGADPMVDIVRVLDPEEHDEIEAEESCLAGSGLNAARILTKLKRSPEIVGYLPEEDRAAFTKLTAGYGIPFHSVSVPGSAGQAVKSLRKGIAKECAFEGGFSVLDKSEEELLDLIGEHAKRAELILLCGKAPQGSSEDFWARAGERLGNTPFAADLAAEDLKRVLPYHPALVKLNLDVFSAYCGKTVKKGGKLRKALKRLHSDGARNILVTLGRDGTAVSGDDEGYCARQKNIHALNPQGAGTAALCGAVDALLCGKSSAEQACFATAAGSAKVLEISASGFDARLFRSLAGNIEVTKL